MSSSFPNWICNELQTSLPKDLQVKQNLDHYVETWLSPAAFHRNWDSEEESPIRFSIDIDIVDNPKV